MRTSIENQIVSTD